MLSIYSFTKYPTRAHAVPKPVLGPRDRAETARARPTLGGGGGVVPGVNNLVRSASQTKQLFFSFFTEVLAIFSHLWKLFIYVRTDFTSPRNKIIPV